MNPINSISTLNSLSKMDSNMIEYQVDEYGIQRWYQNGKLHRTDGPAIICPDGKQQWYRNGRWITDININQSHKIFIKQVKFNIKDGF